MPSRRGLVVILLLVLMELMAGFVLVVGSGFLDGNRPGYGLFWFLLLAALAGVIVGMITAAVQLHPPLDRILLVVVGLALAGGIGVADAPTLSSFALIGVLVGLAYYRGIAGSEEPPEHAEVQMRFGFGLTMFVIGMIWTLARGAIYENSIWHMLAFLGIAYVITSMIALVLSRLEPGQARGAGSAVALAVIFQLGLLVVISLGGLLLFAHDLGSEFFTYTRPFWNLVGLIWVSIWSLVLYPILWLSQFLHGFGTSAHHQPPQHSYAPKGNSNKHLKAPHPNNLIPTIIGFVLLALIVIGVISLIWKAIPRLPRRTPERGYSEERHWMSPGQIVALFLAWLRGLFHRGADLAHAAAEVTRRRVMGPTYPDDPVRQVYARLLRRAEVAGLPRPDAVTPVEFQRHLAARWPTGATSFAVITDAYVLRRYGDVSFAEEQIQDLRNHWQRLRLLIRRKTAEEIVPVSAAVALPSPPPPRSRLAWLGPQSFLRNAIVEAASAITAIVVILLLLFGGVAAIIFLTWLSHR